MLRWAVLRPLLYRHASRNVSLLGKPRMWSSEATISSKYFYLEPEQKDKRVKEEQKLVAEGKGLRNTGVKIGGVRSDGKTPRFFKTVEVNAEDSGYIVRVDGRPLKSPKERKIVAPTKRLALCLASEWEYQDKFILPSSMPMTRLASGVLDLLPEGGSDMVRKSLLDGLRTDITVLRDNNNFMLSDLQKRKFAGVVRWFETHFGKVIVSSEYGGVTHPADTLQVVQAYLNKLDDWQLAGLEPLANASKSLILSLALMHGATTYEEAFKLARLEETLQAEAWGEVEGGHDIDKADLAVRLSASIVWLQARGDSPDLPK
eukprot:TRINITY_DN3973_c0_g1_i2.p1 TRINITY_DN3973_c0_g1~~TRINITY_DN3973_c0_g1_i2.p1  ORF type:complete len:317 (+),score=41.62 TRINITY_DN3973_c0_g1_i2:125-1075(+)